MPTRRALLASAAIAPLLKAGLRSAQAQVETPGGRCWRGPRLPHPNPKPFPI